MKTWHIALAGMFLLSVSALVGALATPKAESTRMSLRDGNVELEEASVVPSAQTANTVREEMSVSESNASSEAQPCSEIVEILSRELELSELQCHHVAEVLADRTRQIEAYHRDIREARIFNAREYSGRIRDLLARSYERMSSMMDSRQYARFVELLRLRALPDPVSFTIEPGMTVLK